MAIVRDVNEVNGGLLQHCWWKVDESMLGIPENCKPDMEPQVPFSTAIQRRIKRSSKEKQYCMAGTQALGKTRTFNDRRRMSLECARHRGD